MRVSEIKAKEVSPLNYELFREAKRIMQKEENLPLSHIGWAAVGAYVDWLEENYTITKKDNF